jgi:hypothetical protein
MHALLRVVPFVLAVLLSGLNLPAQTEALPPIFAKKREPVATFGTGSAPIAASSALSDRVRGLIAQRVLADSGVFTLPAAPSVDPIVVGAMFGSTVMMNPLVVKSSSLRGIELPRADPPLLNFLKRGTLYHHVGRKITTRISLNFLPVASTGYGGNETGTMAQLRFSFSW